MEAGIVGLPYVGKTTLFNALTSGAFAASAAAGVGRPNIGVAQIPDPRLDLITRFIPPKKVIPASMGLVDIPGLQAGGQSAKFLDHIRQVDAVCHVVPCFEDDMSKAAGGRNAERDIDMVESELIIADLQTIETALPKAERSARSKDPRAVARLAAMTRVQPVLDEGRPIRAMLGEITDESELLALRELGMVSAKKVLYVANVGEDDVRGEGALAQAVKKRAEADGMEYIALCAKIEAELVELEPGDRKEMLEALGLTEPAAPALARSLYKLLGLQSFFTAGEKEVRAWTIKAGFTAPEAAGAIHSDIERGFIRAEVYKVGDLEALKSEKAIKEANKLRSEGKNYVMQDGDVVHFLFNV